MERKEEWDKTSCMGGSSGKGRGGLINKGNSNSNLENTLAFVWVQQNRDA